MPSEAAPSWQCVVWCRGPVTQIWSEVPGTTDPEAPFGIVTLASSGSEGGPNMGAMRQAQTAGFGVLPAAADKTMANTFFAQGEKPNSYECLLLAWIGHNYGGRSWPWYAAYDLDDQWGGPSWVRGSPIQPKFKLSVAASSNRCPMRLSTHVQGRMACHYNHEGDPCIAGPTHQPCFLEWNCCPVGAGERIFNISTYPKTCNATRAKLCAPACAAAAGTPEYMGGIHPRSKKPVGDRLGTAAYNTVYKGKGAYTGPTLAGCSLDATSLIVQFDSSPQLSGSQPLRLNKIKPAAFGTTYKNLTIDIKGVPTLFAQGGWAPTTSRFESENASFGGSLLYVQTDATNFCMEPVPAHWNSTTGAPIPDNMWYCPTWAGEATVGCDFRVDIFSKFYNQIS